MKNLRAFLLVVFIVITGSGCGTFQKVFKSKELNKSESKQVLKSDSSGLTIDKSITTIKEKADTTVKTKEKKVSQDSYLNMDSLVHGMTAIKNDLVEVKLVLNPTTGILTAEATLKPQDVNLKFDRETTIQNDISQKSSKKQESFNQEKKEEKKVLKEKEPVKMGVWILSVLAGLLFLWFIFKSFKNG